jgi:threonine aldolase
VTAMTSSASPTSPPPTPPRCVDLRSDTVTRPTRAMLDAMMQAEVGDDVFGEDPSVNALQDKIADLLGFEAALFMATGTQSNLCGIVAHCERGDEFIVGQMAHTYRWEGGGAAVLGSVQPQPILQQADGSLALSDIEAAIKPDDAHFARTRMLALENTWGGKVLPMKYLVEASTLAHHRGLTTHLDGARLFNAAVAQAAAMGSNPMTEARRIALCFDSVSVCFSKGLGTPAGSALCGSRDFIARAHRWRKMVGGGMRQAGILAAAATHALDHHVHRLYEDHARMQRLARGLQGLPGIEFEAPQTNILFVDLVGPTRERAAALSAYLKQHGVLANGSTRLRLVTHLDISQDDVDHAIAVFRRFFAQ